MNIDYKDFFVENSRVLLYLVIILIVIMIIVYAATQTSLQKNNCKKIKKKFMPLYTIKSSSSIIGDTVNITQMYIKTAYNCCCSGKFKNDYVDICALKNCAKYGVRALDFQIYKLNGKPIISASSVNEITYKEIYNYLAFNDTMLQVNTLFIQDTNLANVDEPLFLIFRVYSKAKDTYDQMFVSLNDIFGSGLDSGSILFFTNDLTTATFGELKGKVIIIVQYACVNVSDIEECKTSFTTSSLSRITALNYNNSLSRIYTESQNKSGLFLEKNTTTQNGLKIDPKI